ncbi:MAG: 1-acyl-sn-glycerol-3-phosphate acyltransferase, partial [Acidiferrobacterales bacterium]
MGSPDLIEGQTAPGGRETLLQRGWCLFCGLLVRIFCGRCEAQGFRHLPTRGPVLLCANHPNSALDAITIQAVCPRLIHPLAKSGLFENPLARPWLRLMQAVPMYRRQDPGVDTARNIDSFAACYELFVSGGVLLIFPEGTTHSDPRLRELRTGAARIALGSIESTGTAPMIFPVGVNFSEKGTWRSDVFVKMGEAIDLKPLPGEDQQKTVRRLTGLIEQGLNAVTLSADTLEELQLSRRLERFFAMRRGRYDERTLAHHFRVQRKLIGWQRTLREREPKRVAELSRRLDRFERLCRRLGIHDYQLTLSYRFSVIARFVLHALIVLLVFIPLGVWGWINSAIPYNLTRVLVARLATGLHDRDFWRMAVAVGAYTVAWGAQTAIVAWLFGAVPAVIYLLSLPIIFAVAMMLERQRNWIIENMQAFFLFMRKRKLRAHLLKRRRALETELARMIRLLRRPLPSP